VINGIEMVVDRDAVDVERVARLRAKGLQNMTAKELSEFMAGMKGAYNFTDVNRVEAACEFLAGLLFGYALELKSLCSESGVALDKAFLMQYNEDEINELQFKSDWSAGDLFTAEERKRYINNARAICSALFELGAAFPQSLDKLNHNGANRIEATLDKVEPTATAEYRKKKNYIEQAKDAWAYSDDVFGGEI
jgi:hypothetical protein